jgi:biotin carboxylase
LKHRLAVAYDADSSSPMEISGAIGDVCDLVWVVDSSQPLGAMARMLPRLGVVVDRAGLSPAGATAAVADAKPEGVLAFTDSQLAITADLAAALGLRFNRPDVTARFLDKHAQRSALRAAGIDVPGFVTIPAHAGAGDLPALTAGVSFPAVLKPRRGYGSRETYHVENAPRLAELLAPGASRLAPSEEYVLEEYLADAGAPATREFGSYVSVESVVADGEPRHLAVTGKFPLAEPFRETGNFMPSSLDAAATETVRDLAGRAISALGVEFGCTHTEIKLTPAGPRVIELNARVGGGGTELIFGMAYDESLMRLAAMTALGLELPPTIASVRADIAYFLVVQPPLAARQLTRLDGLDAVGALPGVAQVTPNRGVGDDIDWRRGSQGYVVSVRGTAPDHDTLRRLRAQVQERLVLEYER